MAKKKEDKIKLDPIEIVAHVPAQKSGDTPVIKIKGNYCQKYNEADAIKKSAEEFMKELKPTVLPYALAEICQHNTVKHWDTISSVKLEDATGSVTRVTSMNKYSSAQAPVVEELFASLVKRDGSKPNVNDYMQRTIIAKWDNSALSGPDGRFSSERYEAFLKAISSVAAEFGIPNPLSSEEVVVPVSGFHRRRWADFGPMENARITEMLPNQVNFVACPKVAE